MSDFSWHQQRAAGMHALPGDIVGYAYRAEVICPFCIPKVFKDPDVLYGGEPSEIYLDRIAGYRGMDRDGNLDSGEFPTVTLRSMLSTNDECVQCGEPSDAHFDVAIAGHEFTDPSERCGNCGRVLGE